MSDRKTPEPLAYSEIELRSYLPSGWNLESTEGEYSEERKSWQIEVQDISELVFELIVRQKDADRLGRIPALRSAIDRLYRRV